MEINAKNQSLLHLVKRLHGIVENTDIEKQRQMQDQLGAIFGQNKAIQVRETDIDGMYGEWLCVNRAHGKKPVILYCHGGGYSTGSSLYARNLTMGLAAATAMEVLSFDYRLAPEHPYPAAIEDAVKAWDYLMLFGYGAGDVILAGDSAGGNLALALTHRLREEGRLLPKGLVLFSPWTDLTSSGKSYETKEGIDPVLNAAYIRTAIENYMGSGYDKALLKEPSVSPLFGTFEGFPPTYIQVGDQEILHSDSALLYKKMKQAGVNVTLDVFKGMWHVFQMAHFKTAADALDKSAEFIFTL